MRLRETRLDFSQMHSRVVADETDRIKSTLSTSWCSLRVRLLLVTHVGEDMLPNAMVLCHDFVDIEIDVKGA